MIVKTSQTLALAAALFASAPVFAQSEEPVRVKVDGLSPHVATQVQSKAAQGSSELRRFIERTRAIYELNYGSVVAQEAQAAVATKSVESKLASR